MSLTLGGLAMIHFVCSHPLCRKKLKIDDRGAGWKINCPRCQQSMLVPQLVPHPGEDAPHPLEIQDSEELPLPCDPASGSLDPTIPQSSAAAYPLPTRRRRKGPWILGGALAGFFILSVVLVAGWVVGVSFMSGLLGNSRLSKAEFEKMAGSCNSRKELIEKLGKPDAVWPKDFVVLESWAYDDFVVDPATNRPFGRVILELSSEHEISSENKFVVGIRYIPFLQK
jgi:hypothetical protein